MYQKKSKRKKRSLAGIKAARTRARNRKQLALPPNRTYKRKIPTKRALPVKTVQGTRSRTSTRENANATRLQKMHREAKRLQKTHPKTKYSTLLKKAAKNI